MRRRSKQDPLHNFNSSQGKVPQSTCMLKIYRHALPRASLDISGLCVKNQGRVSGQSMEHVQNRLLNLGDLSIQMRNQLRDTRASINYKTKKQQFPLWTVRKQVDTKHTVTGIPRMSQGTLDSQASFDYMLSKTLRKIKKQRRGKTIQAPQCEPYLITSINLQDRFKACISLQNKLREQNQKTVDVVSTRKKLSRLANICNEVVEEAVAEKKPKKRVIKVEATKIKLCEYLPWEIQSEEDHYR